LQWPVLQDQSDWHPVYGQQGVLSNVNAFSLLLAAKALRPKRINARSTR